MGGRTRKWASSRWQLRGFEFVFFCFAGTKRRTNVFSLKEKRKGFGWFGWI